MKLSLAWAFDHIQANRAGVDFEQLIVALGKTTAEIDGVTRHSFDWGRFFVGVVSSSSSEVVLKIPEKNKNITLPLRPDAVLGVQLLVVRDADGWQWCTYRDLGGVREGLLPELFVAESALKGAWRDVLEAEDWVLDIDNKSLTNRPDLWGHRGFAREIAAILKCDLVPEERLCLSRPICHFDDTASLASIKGDTACNRFAVVGVSDIKMRASSPFFVSRLVRLGARPINAIVDLTNYVMFDLGHPMHAFDADRVHGGQLVVRAARGGESLVLLDGSKVSLTCQDCVVADSQRVLSLAGVMGGLESGISSHTKNIILEAAHFDPTAIRLSAQRAKVRTDSSMRFEKGLDPHANIAVLERYLALLVEEKIGAVDDDESIVSLGRIFDEVTIDLPHRLLIDKLGCVVVESDVVAIFQRLGFGVATEQVGDQLVYHVNVPLFRSYRDVRIPEDLIEEVARFVGYDSIPQQLPRRQMRPFDLAKIFHRRAIKAHCAFAHGMREVARYSLYDESFLRESGIHVGDAQELENPLSENHRRLVTSLVPHLLQSVQVNAILRDELRFFEMARTWTPSLQSEGALPEEKEMLAGILFSRKPLDFYEAKNVVVALCDVCKVYPEWRLVSADNCPVWFDQSETAELWLEGRCIGLFGRISLSILSRLVAGHANCFAFELESAFLLDNSYRVLPSYEQISRYQATFFDVSIFAPYSVSVADLQNKIASLDARIREVSLVDMFEKPEWQDARSVTIRYLVQDDETTLTKEELDSIQSTVSGVVVAMGCEVR